MSLQRLHYDNNVATKITQEERFLSIGVSGGLCLVLIIRRWFNRELTTSYNNVLQLLNRHNNNITESEKKYFIIIREKKLQHVHHIILY